MNNLTKTAKSLDTVFRILEIAVKICIVGTLVGLAIIAAGFLFQLDPYTIGTGYNNLNIGCLSLTLAEAYAPDEHLVLMLLAVELVIALVCLLILRPCVACVRSILQPMTEGKPFHTTVSANLKKLAKRSILLCVLVNLAEIFTTSMFFLNLTDAFISEKITHVSLNMEFDLTFLVVAAVLYLLSYIFQYGEELQQLSDETL